MPVIVIPSHAFDLGNGRVLATHVPAGRWDVRVFEVPASHGLVVAYAVSRGRGEDSFAIAAGRPYAAVARAARAWVDSATATISRDRVRYVGPVWGHEEPSPDHFAVPIPEHCWPRGYLIEGDDR